jgi:hypothetical protein
LLDRIAAQWIALGVSLAGTPDETLIDLEAVIAVTAQFGRDESRIYEGALDWCARYGMAINVTRLKAVADEIAVDPVALGTFAALVAGAGGPHWPVVGDMRLEHEVRAKVHVRDLRSPAVISWRLRCAFGVTARADILTVLAASPDAALSLADLARLTRSTKRTVAFAVRALALAEVLEVEQVRNEQRVRITRHSGFRDWLGRTPPGFVDWTARYAVVASVLRFDGASSVASLVQAIEARALVERHLAALRRNSLPLPDTSLLGESFGPEFVRWRDALASATAP